MKVEERETRFIAQQLPIAKAGDAVAMYNIGAAYRILGKHTTAFKWWRKSADLGDCSGILEVGYCLHHGAGARRDLNAAAIAYERVISSDDASQYELEEAKFLRAVLLLDSSSGKARRRIAELLREANQDNDYPQAAALFASLQKPFGKVCTCRRGLRPGLAKLHCRVHKPRKARLKA